MLIFTMGIVSVYAVISSSLRINEYNKNYIIAVNLAREQVELFRNNRDYNYKHIQKFDQINPAN
jgi:Tfp pilus assembly protein PilV